MAVETSTEVPPLERPDKVTLVLAARATKVVAVVAVVDLEDFKVAVLALDLPLQELQLKEQVAAAAAIHSVLVAAHQQVVALAEAGLKTA